MFCIINYEEKYYFGVMNGKMVFSYSEQSAKVWKDIKKAEEAISKLKSREFDVSLLKIVKFDGEKKKKIKDKPKKVVVAASPRGGEAMAVVTPIVKEGTASFCTSCSRDCKIIGEKINHCSKNSGIPNLYHINAYIHKGTEYDFLIINVAEIPSLKIMFTTWDKRDRNPTHWHFVSFNNTEISIYNKSKVLERISGSTEFNNSLTLLYSMGSDVPEELVSFLRDNIIKYITKIDMEKFSWSLSPSNDDRSGFPTSMANKFMEDVNGCCVIKKKGKKK